MVDKITKKERDRMRRRKRARNKRLKPFAHMYNYIVCLIEEMGTRQLSTLISDTTEVTNINCWCATFSVAPIVQRLAKEELYRRKYRESVHKTTQ